MRRVVCMLLAITIAGVLLVSCSSSDSTITAPDPLSKSASVEGSSHMLMGLWEFYVDPQTRTFEYTKLRSPDLHLNVLPFLEPEPLLYLTIEGGIIYDLENSTVQVDIGLKHPFTGLDEFAGFDVKGICISRAGPAVEVPSATLKMPGPSTLRLLNADGYSRMWNPDEFPYNPDSNLFCYNDGMLGAPDSYGQYDAQINGYKYFCDGLAPGDPVGNMQLERRGVFTPGAKNVRTFLISMPEGLIFNYAVDASWTFPEGGPPWTIPDDYPTSANSPEAYNIESYLEGVLYSGAYGSTMDLTITVYDHQPGTIQSVYIESIDICDTTPSDPPPIWTASFQYSTQYTDVYSAHLTNENMVMEGIYPALICVEDAVVNPLLPVIDPPAYYAAYKLIDIPVTTSPNIIITLEEDAAMKGEPAFNVSRVYDAAYFITPPTPPDPVVDYMDHDGPWEFDYTYDDTVTISSIPVTDPEAAGFSGSYPPQVTHFYKGIATYENEYQFRPYLGEYHDYANGVRKIYGVTEEYLLGMTAIFNNISGANVPMEFIYPYDQTTDFATTGRYFVTDPIPFEAMAIVWRVRGLGEGQLKLSPAGPTYMTLLMRHDITIRLAYQNLLTAIVYEWLMDDGTPLAYIVSANSDPLGWGNYFNPNTGEIFGESRYHVLQGY